MRRCTLLCALVLLASTTVRATPEAGLPDLFLRTFTATVLGRTTVRFVVTVCNAGRGTGQAFDIHLFAAHERLLADCGARPAPEATIRQVGLSAGACRTHTLDRETKRGVYTALAIADGACKVAEGNEGNNGASVHYLVDLRPPRPAEATLQRLLCKSERLCRVAAVKPAGQVQGVELLVVETVRHVRGALRDVPYKTANLDDCAPYDYTLVRRRGGKLLGTQRLVSMCNDGYGAAGVGEDHVAVQPNRFEYTQSGGSAWRWSTKKALQLEPLQLIEVEREGYWTLGTNIQETTWGFARFSGQSSWYAPTCDAQGKPPDSDIPREQVPRFRYRPIPLVSPGPDYAAALWKQTELGACAVQVDAEAGFVVRGRRGRASDAALRVLALDARTLIVEVDDDRLVRGRVSDELWLVLGQGLDYGEHCIPRAHPRPRQLRIRVVDGRVLGKGDQLVVQKVTLGKQRLRFKLSWPQPTDADQAALSVAYADTDDGRRHTRILATSTLDLRRASTLGRTLRIAPSRARCVISGGRLVPRVLPIRSSPGAEVLGE